MKEVELYGPVKNWLEDRGYTVYPEVECVGSRADIVAVNGDHVIIVELKTSLSIELISQGVCWVHRKSANQVYVAVPMPWKGVHWYAHQLLTSEGIGLILVDTNRLYGDHGCQLALPPKDLVRDHKGRFDISKSVSNYHLELGLQGGHAGGGYLTGYKVTMLKVKEYLTNERQGQWTVLKDIITNVDTHYRGNNPGSSLGNALEKFESDWCETKIMNRKKHFRVKGVGK
ncbi:hypothetical protein D1872_50770 [compost metagenome]